MKKIVYCAFAAALALLSFQLYTSYGKSRASAEEVSRLASEAAALEAENERIRADLKYYADAENLAKELKAKFDYKRPGEILYKLQ